MYTTGYSTEEYGLWDLAYWTEEKRTPEAFEMWHCKEQVKISSMWSTNISEERVIWENIVKRRGERIIGYWEWINKAITKVFTPKGSNTRDQ